MRLSGEVLGVINHQNGMKEGRGWLTREWKIRLYRNLRLDQRKDLKMVSSGCRSMTFTETLMIFSCAGSLTLKSTKLSSLNQSGTKLMQQLEDVATQQIINTIHRCLLMSDHPLHQVRLRCTCRWMFTQKIRQIRSLALGSSYMTLMARNWKIDQLKKSMRMREVTSSLEWFTLMETWSPLEPDLWPWSW